MQVGEVAAAATRHQDFFADLVGAFEHDHTSSAIAGRDCAQEPGSTATDDDYVSICHDERIAAPVFLGLSLSNAL